MQVTAEKLWVSALEVLRSMLNSETYNLWFAPVRAVGLEGEVLTLEVANEFWEVWLKDNYLGLIRDVLMQESGQPLKIKFKVAEVESKSAAVVPSAAPAKSTRKSEPSETSERNNAHRDLG